MSFAKGESRATSGATGGPLKTISPSTTSSFLPRSRVKQNIFNVQRAMDPPGVAAGTNTTITPQGSLTQQTKKQKPRQLLGFRHDLVEEDQLRATDVHRAERQRDFMIASTKQASFPLVTSATYVPSPTHPLEGKLHFDYSYQEKDLLWVLKMQVVEAHLYHNHLYHITPPLKKNNSNSVYTHSSSGGCTQKATTTEKVITEQGDDEVGGQHHRKSSFHSEAFVKTLLHDIGVIFQMCYQQDKESGGERGYYHAKEQLAGINMWAVKQKK